MRNFLHVEDSYEEDLMSRRAAAPQDDKREKEMLRIFGLRQNLNTTRGDKDAFFQLESGKHEILELKSSTKDTFVTARDFGPNHILKWRKQHFLGSFYDAEGNEIQRSIFIPNFLLNNWLDEQTEYIAHDLAILDTIRSLLHSSDAAQNIKNAIFGDNCSYDISDVKKLMKRQYKKIDYDKISKRVGKKIVVSNDDMNNAIMDRIEYLLNRGTTRNNPHINKTFLNSVVSFDKNLELIHDQGDYSSPATWIASNIEKYKLTH